MALFILAFWAWGRVLYLKFISLNQYNKPQNPLNIALALVAKSISSSFSIALSIVSL